MTLSSFIEKRWDNHTIPSIQNNSSFDQPIQSFSSQKFYFFHPMAAAASLIDEKWDSLNWLEN